MLVVCAHAGSLRHLAREFKRRDGSLARVASLKTRLTAVRSASIFNAWSIEKLSSMTKPVPS